MNGIMHLILYCCKEFFRNLTIKGIINGSSINVRDFLIETALTGPNFLYFRNQVVKIVLIKDLTVNQSALVQNISLFSKSVQHLCCPLPELRCSAGVNTVTNSDDSG